MAAAEPIEALPEDGHGRSGSQSALLPACPLNNGKPGLEPAGSESTAALGRSHNEFIAEMAAAEPAEQPPEDGHERSGSQSAIPPASLLNNGRPGLAPAVIELDLSKFHQVEDLALVSIPRLKMALKSRGMTTGGGAFALAERLWWRSKMSDFADVSRRYVNFD